MPCSLPSISGMDEDLPSRCSVLHTICCTTFSCSPTTSTGVPMSEPSAVKPTVVVIGGGYGGISAAKALDEVADVVLVEPKDAFVHNVAALRALTDPSD